MIFIKRRCYLPWKYRKIIFIYTLLFIAYSIIFSLPVPKSGVHLNFTDKSNQKRLNVFLRTLDQIHTKIATCDIVKEDKGTGCVFPKFDPFAAEIMRFDKTIPEIVCSGHDWVKCYFSKCTIDQKLIYIVGDEIECTYNDILYNGDFNYTFGPSIVLRGNQEYTLKKSDHVKIKCELRPHIAINYYGVQQWSGYGVGFRPLSAPVPPPGREDTVNVLIFAYDSTAKNGFIRKMPKSYKYMTEDLGAIVLNGYNIVGDATPAALFPLLTGKTELELPEFRKSIPSSEHLDDAPWIFHKLRKDGYRTAYFEDSPSIGTFQDRFNGFRRQPTDHYLRAFLLEADKHADSKRPMRKYCVGDTPRYKLLMNLTDEFLKLDGKRFVFTFIADICHDDFNMISTADQPFVDFLRILKERDVFKDTLLIVMGDHGPRYTDVRITYQGKMEERLPLMAIRLPDNLKKKRPKAFENLVKNVDTLTTVHDVHAMILDVVDLTQYWNKYKVQGADLTRGISLLELINKNRSCSEAGIEPQWCTCLKWKPVGPDEPMFERTAHALLNHINRITIFKRSKCALRTLTSIDSVVTNTAHLDFLSARAKDGFIGNFGPAIDFAKIYYQVKITLGPGTGVYEATVTHLVKENKLSVKTRHISRINAYNFKRQAENLSLQLFTNPLKRHLIFDRSGDNDHTYFYGRYQSAYANRDKGVMYSNEPDCISAKYPQLNMFCYCNKHLS